MTLPRQLQSALGSAYTVDRELGGGGMSRVFVATEISLAREVVVKVLPPELTAGVNVDRFRREILLAARLQHPHIVPILSAGEMDGLPYYVMPFVKGESLRERLNRGADGMPIGEAIGVLRDVARALAFAHRQGVVHRDIKPENVLLAEGSAVVADFGIAKALAESKRDDRVDNATSGLTAMGTSIGTPAYMAPEQAAADPATDHRADLYAFGVMAYEMLGGRLPFVSSSPQRLLAMHMSEKPAPLATLRPQVPAALADMVMRCLEKEQSARPESATSIVSTLESVTTGESTSTISVVGGSTLRNALVLYAATFVGVAIAAKAAITGIGLPEWVFPGALIVMALGLPALLVTGYVQHLSRRSRTPTGTVEAIALKARSQFTWQRTTWAGVIAVGVFVAAVGAFMALRAAGIGPIGSLLAAGRIKASDPILIADFEVSGADSGLRTVVAEAVRTDLGQSDAVKVVSPSTVAAALARMTKPATTRLDLATAREVAQREGLKAIVSGDLTPIGGGFVVSLRLVSADSGFVLASFREVAGAPTDLIPVLDKLTRQLRARIGESLKAVHASAPLDRVTTASLPALQKFAEGARLNDIDGNYEAAVTPLRAAVALDPEFAMAWRKLGTALGNAFMSRAAADSAATKAYRYRDRLTDRERYPTEAFYFTTVGRDRAKAVAAYESLTTRYGDNHNNLAILYNSRREWARAESTFRVGMRAQGAIAQLYVNIVDPLIAQGKLDEARKVTAAGRARFPGSTVFDEWEWSIYYNEGKVDTAVAMIQRIAASNQPQKRQVGQFAAFASLRNGQLSGFERGPMGPAQLDIWYREQPARGLATLDSTLAHQPFRSLPPRDRRYLAVATLYAQAGNPQRARAILAERDAEHLDSTTVRVEQPLYHRALAEIALAERRGRDAVREFLAGDRLPDGPADRCEVCLMANLGRAYDQAGDADSTIAMYERYLVTPSWTKIREDALYLAGIRKRLGELYEAKGQREKAISNYSAFVELWSKADADLQPKVAEVRKRLERLSKSGGH